MAQPFIHHVFFWLNDPSSAADKAALIKGLEELASVQTIQSHYIGTPAATRREVIDSSYDVSWCLFFNNAADQDAYQVDPAHLAFVEHCKHLWRKVVVYDAAP